MLLRVKEELKYWNSYLKIKGLISNWKTGGERVPLICSNGPKIFLKKQGSRLFQTLTQFEYMFSYIHIYSK